MPGEAPYWQEKNILCKFTLESGVISPNVALSVYTIL